MLIKQGSALARGRGRVYFFTVPTCLEIVQIATERQTQKVLADTSEGPDPLQLPGVGTEQAQS